MRRTDLEHLIRAAAAISGELEFVVLGTSSLLASVPAPPAPLSMGRRAWGGGRLPSLPSHKVLAMLWMSL